MVEVSVVIPVYNSEACLDELCRRLAEALRDLPHEVILVDDRSTDGSWRKIRALCEGDKRLTGVRLRKNAGQDNAVLCGLRLARGRYAAVMDDDLQHSPADIPALYGRCREEGLDVCYARFAALKEAWWKRAGSRLNGRLAEIVIGKPKALYLSPFKVMRREIVEEIVKYTGPFPYVDGLILGVTRDVGQLDVAHNARYRGEGHYTVAKSVLVFLRVATGFSVWPLRFSSYLGIACSLCGFALALFYLVQFAVLKHRVEGWITLVVLQLVVGGLLLFAIGVVGEYLGRLYLSCSGKPQATVKEIVGGASRPACPEETPP
jgi:undecaprenyl-phosphate 4-deoxy-4-formamido-L-arabinose transferase